METNKVVLNQFEAAMQMLRQCIAECPEAEWSAPHADAPFSQVVFHALFFTDIYLGRDEGTAKLQPFHRAHGEFFGDYEELEDRVPVRTYARPDIVDYFEFCLGKGRREIMLEDDASLRGGSGFPYRQFSRLELHIYSIRHVQHHAAQLGLRNQLSTGSPLAWRSSGWKE